MSDLVRLDVDHVVEMNHDICAETGEHSNLLDRSGLEAALERPWSGFGEHESFPTLYEKAAALLQAIAARQVFENGNKRTAWLAAVTTLEVNGIDIGKVDTSHSDMFVRAAALDRTLEVSDFAEWFETARRYRRVGHAVDPRIEYLALASDALHDAGTYSADGVHLHLIQAMNLPTPFELFVILRIHWHPDDLHRRHALTFRLAQESKVAAPLRRKQAWTAALGRPMVGGHTHHEDGVMPHLVVHQLPISLIAEGASAVVVELDGEEIGRAPFRVASQLWAPDFPPTLVI